MKHTIKLYRGTDCWLAWHSDPKVKALMGTDVIPTAFTPHADPLAVLDTIAQLNPESEVFLLQSS